MLIGNVELDIRETKSDERKRRRNEKTPHVRAMRLQNDASNIDTVLKEDRRPVPAIGIMTT